jgi:DNA repair exonuclease SbcCD ATPase subunit
MQLKTLGESTTALSKLKEALQQIDTNGTVGMPRMAEENRLLAEAFSGCSMEATKMAITQSSLNQTQIEAILKQKGLKGEILETTTADLANAASVNAVAAAEKKATASTIGFGAAVKGLGVALKNLVIAHPIVATITVIGTAIALYAQFGNTLKNLQKKAKESKQEYDDVTTEIKSLNDELKTTKDRIEELQNKDVLTIVEQEELDKLKETNDELERELRIKETIAQRKGQDAADKAQDAITKKSESYNGHYAINDPDMTLQDNPYVYDKGDRIDAANWDIEQAKQNNQELEALYEKRREIEEKYNNDDSQFTNDKEWKNNEKNIESKKAYIESVEDSASAYIEALMDEDDALYDSNDKIIKGKEELVNRLLELYKKFDEYNSTETPDDKEVFDKYYNDAISSAQEKYGTDADWESWFGENVKTKEEVDKWLEIQKACDDATEAKKKYLETPISKNDTSLDLTSQLTESDDKGTSKATLADLRSEADLLKTVQKEMSETGKIGVSSMQSIIKQYPEAKEALSEYVAGIINEQELFAQLENVYNDDKTQYVNAVLEKVQADEEFFSSLKTGYPEVLAEIQNFVNQSNTLMEQAKESYINSIVAEEETCDKFLSFIKQTYPELYNELAEIYGNDKENFIRHIIAENETNKDFIDLLRTAYPDLANALATVYGNDVDNWTSMEQAKAQITANLINQLNALWTQYFEGISDTFNAFGSIMENADGSGYTFVGGQDDSDSYDHNMSEEEWQQSQKATSAYDKVKDKINSAIKIANEAVVKLQDSSYNQIENSIGGLDWDDLGSDSSSSSGSDSGSDSSDKDNSKDYDLIERKIKKLESAISALDTAVSDTYTSWGNRNSALVDELSSVSDEIALQQQAYQRYMDLANSVGLDGYYEDLIKNGEMDVITVDDENLQDQIDKFQDFYDKAQDCNDKIRDLNQNLKELQKTKFDNVVSQFEDISSSISHVVTMLDKYIDLADKHGYYASPELYQKQLEQYNNTLNTLTSERDTLQSKLQESVQSGLIEEGAEAWNDMLQQIQSVNEEIVDTVVNIQEVGNSLRDLNFTIFERGQDDISNLVSEGQFYVDLLDKMNKDLYDDDGKITNEGLTVQGIHSENYAAYLKQADFYAKEISAIEAELANDPANTTLIDKKQEYIEAQRESVLAAYDEKNAIIDLIKDGYDKASDALSKLIDKRKEALEAEKDLHDYQKSVQEKSDKVTELEKQKNAYVNDTSEEAKSKVQQLEVNLKEAQEDLAETEYDKYISDQEKLLDDLQTEYEDLINDRIDNIDKELGYVADAVNLNRDTIRSTLENLSQDTELPLTKAMRDVWNSATPVVDLNTTVQGIGSTVSGITLAINDIITRLNDLIAIMRGNLDSEINNYDDGSYNPNNSTPAPTPSYEPDPEPSYSYDESDDSDSGDDGNYDDLFVYKYYYPQPLDTEHSVVDRLKSNNIDASWDRRADYYEGIFGDDDYTGSDYQNIRMLDWLKEHGYAKGKRRGEYSTGYHLVGEEGNEFVITNGALREVGTEDTIFTADMAKNIADFSINPTQYLSSHMPLPNVKPSSIPNNVTSNVDTIEISLPNVTNYTEFKTQLMNDRGFKSYVSEATLGVALGHNELAVNKYK